MHNKGHPVRDIDKETSITEEKARGGQLQPKIRDFLDAPSTCAPQMLHFRLICNVWRFWMLVMYVEVINQKIRERTMVQRWSCGALLGDLRPGE
eukprot:1160675-Pelagomonas_calceolata.AAC.5